MIRIVPDTNVLISAIFWRGKPYEVIRGGIEGRYTLVTSKEILEELIERLKNKFSFPDEEILFYVDIIFTYFHMIQKTSTFSVVRDKSDNKIIETAVDGKADYIVTGDPDLIVLKEHDGIKIVTPGEFLKLGL